MHTILHIIFLYIHVITTIAPYLVSGVAMYFYQLYKEQQEYRNAIATFAEAYGLTVAEAEQIISTPPLN